MCGAVWTKRCTASIIWGNRLRKIKTEISNRRQITAFDLAVTVPATLSAFMSDGCVCIRISAIANFAICHIAYRGSRRVRVRIRMRVRNMFMCINSLIIFNNYIFFLQLNFGAGEILFLV